MSNLLDKLKGVFRKKPPAVDAYFADGKNWKAVTSSNLAAVAYFLSIEKGAENVLGIRFKDGSEYWYYGVRIGVFSSFMAATSKGKFAHRNIYDVYRAERKK